MEPKQLQLVKQPSELLAQSHVRLTIFCESFSLQKDQEQQNLRGPLAGQTHLRTALDNQSLQRAESAIPGQ